MGRICIYCMHEREPSAFNVDHVIPRAFGVFEENLTLDCVCIECNDYFGKKIELVYGRDSVEAFLRLVHGTKPANEANELPQQRLSITLGGDEDWSGCHIELKEEDGQVTVDLVPQVRFARRQGGWVFVTEEVLSSSRRGIRNCFRKSRRTKQISLPHPPHREARRGGLPGAASLCSVSAGARPCSPAV